MKRKLKHLLIPHEQNDHRPHALRPHFLSFYSVIIIFAKILLTASLFFSYQSPTAFAEITSNQIIELTNQSRNENGLPSVTENSILSKAAFQKAKDMLERDYFDHEDPNGIAPWHWLKDNGYLYSYAGENLAMGFIKAESVHKAWMKSESHRANILNPNYKEIGIAVMQGELNGEKTTLLVQFFGTSFAEDKGEISEFNSSARLETPLSTEIIEDNVKPQLRGKEVTVTLRSEKEKNILSYLILYTKEFYWVILSFLILALLINILVRVKVQHKSVIVQTALVLFLVVTMIFLKTHFLEDLALSLKII